MIVIVAPYAPASRTSSPHLGAARKIESVVRLLSTFGEQVVFINSAHLSASYAAPSTKTSDIGGVQVLEVTPSTHSRRPLGKLLNVVFAKTVSERVLRLGRPSLVWLYNGYAFESRIGALLQRGSNAPVMLEMEDWHFSRSRGLNPKPLLDWVLWRMLMPKVSAALAVNNCLAERIKRWQVPVELFPGCVSRDAVGLRSSCAPFSSKDKATTVGYFGGLTAEKGADWVIRLLRDTPADTRFIVTGSGPLASEFEYLASKMPDRLNFDGVVNDDALIEKMGRCDVIINPHRPIQAMSNGVFPFKVIEAVASGRLVISTRVPGEGLEEALQGVEFVDDEYEEMLEAVVAARQTFERRKYQVAKGAAAADRLFSETSIAKFVSAAKGKGQGT